MNMFYERMHVRMNVTTKLFSDAVPRTTLQEQQVILKFDLEAVFISYSVFF